MSAAVALVMLAAAGPAARDISHALRLKAYEEGSNLVLNGPTDLWAAAGVWKVRNATCAPEAGNRAECIFDLRCDKWNGRAVWCRRKAVLARSPFSNPKTRWRIVSTQNED